MSTKRISIGAKPSATRAQVEADTWVDHRGTGDEPEPMKRLTIDVPASLHREIKSQCALRGSKIADEVRELLLQNYRKT